MRVLILTLLFFTPYCLSTVNGLSIREATEATIDETMTVFSSIAEDKNFTDFQPKINNKTEDITIPVNGSVEVTNNQTEKEKPKVNIVEPSSSTTTNTTSKPTDSLSIHSTSTTTTTPVPSTSSTPLNTSMVTSPIISPLNETNPIVDLSAVNDTVANAIFTDLEELLIDLNDPNATSTYNGIDTAAGGVSGGSPDEFASSPEVYIRSIRTRSISKSNNSTGGYVLPIEVVRNESPVEMVTNLPREVTTEMELNRDDGHSINHSNGDGDVDDGEKLEIIVDEPRTAESEKHWAKFSKVTGYKIIWLSDNNQNGRKAETETIGSVDDHSNDSKDTNMLLHENDYCDRINETDYFSTEINSLDRLRSLMGHGYRRVVKTVQCGIMGLSKILELLDDEIEDWTDESILPLNEITRLERKIIELENFECSCPVPLLGDILHSIYIDPFLHEKRAELYKNHEWSSIISDLRSSHVKIKHFNYALHRHHNGIENLFNISIALSHKFYQWRAKQMDIVVTNARTVRHNPYYNPYNRSLRPLYFKPSLSVH